MVGRLAVFIGCVLLAGMLLAGGAPAKSVQPKPQLYRIGIHQFSGPVYPVKNGKTLNYVLSLGNVRNTALSSELQVDLFMNGQKIDTKSVQVLLPPTAVKKLLMVAGHHIRVVVQHLPALRPAELRLSTKVLAGKTKQFCNQFVLTYAGKKGYYAPPCVGVRPGV